MFRAARRTEDDVLASQMKGRNLDGWDIEKPMNGGAILREILADREMPKNLDWRKSGFIWEPLAQGECGSCWAVTAAGALEVMHKLANPDEELLDLSIQQFIDCTSPWEVGGNFGCDGGFVYKAFEYAKNNAIFEQKDYPYTGK